LDHRPGGDVIIIDSLLFTTFSPTPQALSPGIAGSISYWMAQQNVVRGDQPLVLLLSDADHVRIPAVLFGHDRHCLLIWCAGHC